MTSGINLPAGFSLLPDAKNSASGAQLPEGFRLIEDMGPEDLMMPGVEGDPAYEARMAELKRRNMAAAAGERNWIDSRGVGERIADTASFVGSVPIRALTRGQYGLGDVVSKAGFPSAGERVEASERDFARANPGIVWGLGAAGEIGAGIPALSTLGRVAPPRVGGQRHVSPNAAAAVERAAQATEDMGAARRLNVDVPGLVYNDGPIASIPKQLSETPFIGAPVRKAMDSALAGTSRAADDVASRYGDLQTPEAIGRTAREGMERFRDARPADVLDAAARNLDDAAISMVVRSPASATSLKSKQAALYEQAWRQIPEEMRAGRAVEGETRVMGRPSHARSVLQGIIDRNGRMTQRSGNDAAGDFMPVQGGLLGRMLEAVNNPRWSANLQTLRDMRSEIRRLASGMADTERNVLRHSDLERLQGALTSDMVSLLERNAVAARRAGNEAGARSFERSINMFRRADRFTALSMQRMEAVERMFNATSAESLERSIFNAAKTKGRGNNAALRVLDRMLRPEEISQISSGIIREMGRVNGSARGQTQQANFSVSSFVTNWQNMTPEARSILFKGEHRAALDDLVRVANRLANVEALANTSRSGTNTLNVGSVLAAGGAVATGAIDAMTAGLGAAGTGLGIAFIMSRPEYARWMVKYLQIKGRARSAVDGRGSEMADHLRALSIMAGEDPELNEALGLGE